MRRWWERFLQICSILPIYAEKPWFAPAVATLAFLDFFIFIVPLDAIVVGAFLAAPKRRFRVASWTAIGSTLGAVLFALLIRISGLPFLNRIAPGLLEHELSKTLAHWIENHGFWALAGSAAVPIYQHPAVALAALTPLPLASIFGAMMLGRAVKFGVYAYLSHHARGGMERWFRE
jgi:membrane protein YqaA with SNARE-associated domain